MTATVTATKKKSNLKDGKDRAIASCFRVNTNAADPPSVLIDREAIVPSRGETAFFDVRVTHVNSSCNQNKSTDLIFVELEKEKKGKYKQRVSEVSVVVQNNGKEM